MLDCFCCLSKGPSRQDICMFGCTAGVQVNITCSNRFSSLVDEDVYVGIVRQEACEVQRVTRFARKLLGILRACVVSVNRRKLVRF